MKISGIISKLQSAFGVTKSELTVAFLLILGLTLSTFIKYFSNNPEKETYQKRIELQKLLDSLAEENKTSYTGADLSDNVYPELAKGDTVVPKGNFFPRAIKKDTLSEKININTASIAELMKLPGIGKKTAEKIIAFRKEHQFKKPADLMNMPGIGPIKFEKIKPNIVVK